MTCRLRWCVEMEIRCRIPTWRTFGRIAWHVISEPRRPITLQDAATWWIHCRDSRATCHIAKCKNSIRHIENHFSPYFIFFCFYCSLGFDKRRLSYRLRYTCYYTEDRRQTDGSCHKPKVTVTLGHWTLNWRVCIQSIWFGWKRYTQKRKEQRWAIN